MRWLWLSVVVIALDQLSKWLALEWLTLHQSVPVMPSFNLTLMYNRGAAFSLLHDAGGWQRWFFVALALTVSGGIAWWLIRADSRARSWLAAALALIAGGALGNVIDRVRLGHVVDFIQVYYAQYFWPAFNIADSAITVGAFMLVLDSLRRDSADR